MGSPLVTIGIPFYNNEDCLLDSIRSIFAQTFEDWELLLVDDGSSDNSLKLAESINDKRVKVLSDGRNLALATRLNQIASLAEGKYVARMDADDMASPERIEKQIEFLEKNTEITGVGTGAYIIDNEMNPVGQRVPPADHDEIFANIYRGIRMIHPSFMTTKSWYLNHLYDQTLLRCQDQELWLRSRNDSCFANITELLMLYREQGVFSIKKYARSQSSIIRLISKHISAKEYYRTLLFHSLRAYLKLACYTLASLSGLEDKLLNNRSTPLTKNEEKEYHNILAAVKQVELPLKQQYMA